MLNGFDSRPTRALVRIPSFAAVLTLALLAPRSLMPATDQALGAVGTSVQDAQDPSQDPRQDHRPPQDLKPGQSCGECHKEVMDEERVHAPIREDRCLLCHLTPDSTKHAFIYPADMGAVCSECHKLPDRDHKHEPVVEGKCLECHVSHQSPRRGLLNGPTEKAVCAKCHKPQVGEGLKFVHGPVAMGACTLCHSPHSTFEPHLQLMPTNESCLGCHEDMWPRLAPPNTVHTPVGENCALCHDAHASNHRYQLKNEPIKLCLDCHQPMVDELQKQGLVHKALVTNEGCVHCHDPHSSPLPRMLNAPVGELCLSCHEKPIIRPDGTTFPGRALKMRAAEHRHGPVREGNCDACHNPHGSLTFSLLRDPYPKEFYAPFATESYSLCFRCHESAAFLTAKTNTLTAFRDGDQNLHFLHVNKEKKGRTCRACHDTHGSDLPSHMRESVPFGKWDIPIEYIETPTGGSCAPGCHDPETYTNKILPVPPGTPPPKLGETIIKGTK